MFFNNFSKYQMVTEYIARLENIVQKVKVSTLKLQVLYETKKSVVKVLKSSHIEKLIVRGPCTFNAVPVMENLKELEVTAHPPPGDNDDVCSYFKSKADDKKTHRLGRCVVNIGAAYEFCPKLKMFNGHNLAELPLTRADRSKSKLTFPFWTKRLGEHFHEDYTKSGGTMDLKAWTKNRWFSTPPTLPIFIGRERVAGALYEHLFNQNSS